MTTALDNVMNQAAAAAENFSPAVTEQALANYSQPPAPAVSRPTLEGVMSNAGMDVEHYIFPDKAGFKISKEMKGYLEEADVIIDMSEVVPISSFSSELNGSSTFVKSYDGETVPGGSSYALEIARLSRRPGSKNRGPFDTVEIPMELATDVKDPKSALVIEEGTRVGLTPSPTGSGEFARFLKKLSKVDTNLTFQGRIKVKITGKLRTNAANEWGVIAFELLEVLDD